MKKILHICNDDKFIVLGKKIFDLVPNVQNDYWILPKKGDLEFVDFPCRNLYEVNLNRSQIIDEINQYDLLCIEFLNENFYTLLNQKALKVPILWIGWGGDYYWMIDTSSDFELYLPKTKNILHKHTVPLFFTRIINIIKKLKRQSQFNVVQKIDYFAPPIQEDYLAIKSNYPTFKPKFLNWNYGYIDSEVENNYSSLKASGDATLIGNSATPTNNHVDVLLDLKEILKGEQLFIPLNYGDPNYSRVVREFIQNTFDKEQYTIIEDFVSADSYDQILLKCRNFIVGSMRQQAMTTILKCFFLGINIFVYESSVNYKFLKAKGFIFHSIEQLIAEPHLLNIRISQDELRMNQKLIVEMWSIERNRDIISQLVNTL